MSVIPEPTVKITIDWVPRWKRWDITAVLQRPLGRPFIYTTMCQNAGAPDVIAVRRLVAEIQYEIESWLW